MTIHLRTWGDLACFTRPEVKVERVSYPVITPSAARGLPCLPTLDSIPSDSAEVMNLYLLQLEISGPTALWTRPDTGSSPVSYVAPTFSAVKGILEAILRWKSVNVRPTRCGRRRLHPNTPVQSHRCAFNRPDSESGLRKRRSADLQPISIFENRRGLRRFLVAQIIIIQNPRHGGSASLCGRLHRRLERGRWFYTPCLGWKELVLDYVGPLRDGTAPCATENHVIPAFLEMVFDQPQSIWAN